MLPTRRQIEGEASGIATVIRRYWQYFPEFGIELVDDKATSYDLKAVHAGMTGGDCDVCHCHGLYWTADYTSASFEYRANANVVSALRSAKQITVPSHWVAESIAHDMRVYPHVVPHGVEWSEWQHEEPNEGYVLWNKNRRFDVCHPRPVVALAERNASTQFVTTFLPRGAAPMSNVFSFEGVLPFEEMQRMVQRCGVYLATTKETFGVGILEAMAAGKPVLGYAHGGILDTVQHGVNGYLAKPGDEDDLNEGLQYCLQHAETLGANGREIARQFTWRKAVSEVLKVYQLAAKKVDAAYTVVIPCHNYRDKVGRAVDSCLAQTVKPAEIIVVDDKSTDGSAEFVEERYADNPLVKVMRQQNGNVADTRNAGFYAAKTKYLVPLDADDALAIEFAETCMRELEKDPSLGVAYTGLWYIKPNGEEGLSPWPGQWNFNAQLAKQNQVPTACMMRREMFLRLGGYHRKFCPQGAGSEDAEFFLRAGAYGWKAKKVTDNGLFIYSWMSGRVSGNRDYKEVNWTTEVHPWCDGRAPHPFASHATTTKLSHPVHQYDEPKVSVIIPVGPKHTDLLTEALDSLESQTMTHWEAIVVFDGPHDPNKVVRIQRAYPYVKYLFTGEVAKGAGYARNRGMEKARAPLATFLDCDDILYPTFLEMCFLRYIDTKNCIYTGYDTQSFIKDLKDPTLAKDIPPSVVKRDEKTGETIIGWNMRGDFDCERVLRQPAEGEEPYIWCTINVLFPTMWHEQIGGFDETMKSWEDLDWAWRMVRAGHCFSAVSEPLMMYRVHTGSRRQEACPEGESGRQLAQSLLQYIRTKYDKGENPVGCSGCGKQAPVPSRPVTNLRTENRMPVNDEEYVMVKLNSGNIGEMMIVGPTTKQKYGMRVQGETFLMHVLDQRGNPDRYPIFEVELPQRPREEARPPEPIKPVVVEEKKVEPVVVPEPEPIKVEPEPEPEPEPEEEEVTSMFDKLLEAAQALEEPKPYDPYAHRRGRKPKWYLEGKAGG